MGVPILDEGMLRRHVEAEYARQHTQQREEQDALNEKRRKGATKDYLTQEFKRIEGSKDGK